MLRTERPDGEPGRYTTLYGPRIPAATDDQKFGADLLAQVPYAAEIRVTYDDGSTMIYTRTSEP